MRLAKFSDGPLSSYYRARLLYVVGLDAVEVAVVISVLIDVVVDGVAVLHIVSDNLSDGFELFTLSTFHFALSVPHVFSTEFCSKTYRFAPCRLSELFHTPGVRLHPAFRACRPMASVCLTLSRGPNI